MGLALFKVSNVISSERKAVFPQYIFADDAGSTTRGNIFGKTEAKRLLTEWCNTKRIMFRTATLTQIDMEAAPYYQRLRIINLYEKNDGSVLISPKKKIPAFFYKK